MKATMILILAVICLNLFGQVPDSTRIAPGRLVIQITQQFQTISTRSDGIIETEQNWFNALAIQYQIC